MYDAVVSGLVGMSSSESYSVSFSSSCIYHRRVSSGIRAAVYHQGLKLPYSVTFVDPELVPKRNCSDVSWLSLLRCISFHRAKDLVTSNGRYVDEFR